jgi:hypothetical protein
MKRQCRNDREDFHHSGFGILVSDFVICTSSSAQKSPRTPLGMRGLKKLASVSCCRS